jgi:hypothetical protein
VGKAKEISGRTITRWLPYVSPNYINYPSLCLMRPVTGVTKLNPSILSKVFLNFSSLLVGMLGPLSTTRIFAVRPSDRFTGLVVIHCFIWEFVHEPSRQIYRSGCRMQHRIPTVETAAGRCTVFSVGHALTCLRVHEPASSPSVISWSWERASFIVCL